MNESHLVVYLIDFFKNMESLSEYGKSCDLRLILYLFGLSFCILALEYGTALWMNLCLRSSGKRDCLVDPVKTLQVLNSLLEHDR